MPDTILRELQQAAGKEKGPIPVTGTLQGKPFSATVVKFRGMWRLYLNTEMRRAARVEVRDQVTIRIRFDENRRTVPAPKQFVRALSRDRQAAEAFENLTPSRQKEILLYLNSFKRPETLERNIEKVIRLLRSEPVEELSSAAGAEKRGSGPAGRNP